MSVSFIRADVPVTKSHHSTTDGTTPAFLFLDLPVELQRLVLSYAVNTWTIIITTKPIPLQNRPTLAHFALLQLSRHVNRLVKPTAFAACDGTIHLLRQPGAEHVIHMILRRIKFLCPRVTTLTARCRGTSFVDGNLISNDEGFEIFKDYCSPFPNLRKISIVDTAIVHRRGGPDRFPIVQFSSMSVLLKDLNDLEVAAGVVNIWIVDTMALPPALPPNVLIEWALPLDLSPWLVEKGSSYDLPGNILVIPPCPCLRTTLTHKLLSQLFHIVITPHNKSLQV